MRLASRIERLEHDAAPTSGRGVLVMLSGETASDAMIRALAGSRSGGVLLLLSSLTADQWEPLAVLQQLDSLRRSIGTKLEGATIKYQSP